MDTALLICSVTLAAVFGVAGLAKLMDRVGSVEAARSFGVPDRLAGVVGVGLPVVELAAAVLLLPAATRLVGAVAALALLLAFSVAIGAAMARGRAPDCHCFGQLHSSPAGWSTLARNVVLAALAAFVAVGGWSNPGTGAVEWTAGLDAVGWLALGLGVALGAALAVGGYAVAHLLCSYGRVLGRLDAVEERLRSAGFEFEDPDDMPQLGLAPGTAAPAFWLASAAGDRVALGDLLRPGRPVLLLFTSPTCEPCALLMPEVAGWQRDHADQLTVALVSDGDPELIRAAAVEHGLEHVLVDEMLSTYEAYEANGTPSAVLVGDDGSIASWLAAGSEWIETLVEQALAGLGSTPGLPVGTEILPLRLQLLDGAEADLADLIERETVVLFWNPGCGYCRAMHDDVLEWEASRAPEAPGLLVVSAGTAADVRAEGFVSAVFLDPDWTASTALGAEGTPMAVLVEPNGRIASRLVSGAAEALTLLHGRESAATS